MPVLPVLSQRLRAVCARALAYRRSYGWAAFANLLLSPAHWLPEVRGAAGRGMATAVLGGPDDPIWAALERPAAGSTADSALCLVEGWVLCRQDCVDRVDVLVDGALVGQARLGLPRPALAAATDAPAASIAGFQLPLGPDDFPAEGDSVAISAVGSPGTELEFAL